MSWNNKKSPSAKIGLRRLVPLADAADYAGVCTKTMRRWIAESKVPGYRAGRLIRVDLNDVDAALRPMLGGGVA